MNLRPSDRPIWAACALNWVMIGITICGRADAAIAAALPAASAAEKEIAPDGEYLGRVDEFWRDDVFGIPELNQT
jgi:hypothetical protein